MIDWLAFRLCSYSTEFLKFILLALSKTNAPLQYLDIEIQGDVSDELHALIHETKTIKWLFLGLTNVNLTVNDRFGDLIFEAFQVNTSIVHFDYPHEMFLPGISKDIELLIILTQENVLDSRIRQHTRDLHGFALLEELLESRREDPTESILSWIPPIPKT